MEHKKIKDYKFIKQLGFINKNKLSEHKKLVECYRKTDFHILMVKSEACGVVFAEANSFGIFNISHDVGGVSGMIKIILMANYLKNLYQLAKWATTLLIYLKVSKDIWKKKNNRTIIIKKIFLGMSINQRLIK